MLARSRHERYLGSVALRMDSLLPEFSIVVKVDLGIHCHDLAIGGFGQRVHLNHGTVTLDERVINGLDLLFGHGRRLSASELHLLGDGLGLSRRKAALDVDRLFDNGVRVGCRDVLNRHATLGARNDDGASELAIHQDGKVFFNLGLHSFDHLDRVADASSCSGLLRDELGPEHLRGHVLDLRGSLDAHMHTALEAVVEGPEAASSGQDLGLDHHVVGCELGCNLPKKLATQLSETQERTCSDLPAGRQELHATRGTQRVACMTRVIFDTLPMLAQGGLSLFTSCTQGGG